MCYLRKHINLLFIILALLFIAEACNDPGPLEITDLKWLEGYWYDEESNYSEVWEFNNAQYIGSGLTIEGNDTLFAEDLIIDKNKTGIFYNVLIDEQNKGESISFKLVNNDSRNLIFENPDHDFPQRIQYHLLNDTICRVIVETINQEKGFELMMKKQL